MESYEHQTNKTVLVYNCKVVFVNCNQTGVVTGWKEEIDYYELQNNGC